jgi:hypothetical protein
VLRTLPGLHLGSQMSGKVPAAISGNVELVIRIARETLGKQLQCDLAGLDWLDSFVDGQRTAPEERRKALAAPLGSFLGECIVQTLQGTWVETIEGWGVKLPSGAVANPFAKLEKQLENGEEDSVRSFVEVLAVLERHGLPPDQAIALEE